MAKAVAVAIGEATIARLSDLSRDLELQDSDIVALPLLPCHLYGNNIIMTAWMTGTTVVLPSPLTDYQRTADAIKQFGVTFLQSSPALFRLLIAHKTDFSSITGGIVAGSRSSAKDFCTFAASVPGLVNLVSESTDQDLMVIILHALTNTGSSSALQKQV